MPRHRLRTAVALTGAAALVAVAPPAGAVVPQIPGVPAEAIEIMGGHIAAEDAEWPGYVVGTPQRIKAVIERMSQLTGATEFMVQDFLDDPDLRLRNYTLLARTFGL